MKIIVATMKGGLDDSVSPVFGRCATYTILDVDGSDVKDARVAENPAAATMGGAGVQAAQFVVGEKADSVVAGNFGPNAAAVLTQGNVKMIQAQGNAGEVVKKILSGELKPTDNPTVDWHFGVGGGRGGGFGRGRGGGMGRGGRRGMQR